MWNHPSTWICWLSGLTKTQAYWTPKTIWKRRWSMGIKQKLRWCQASILIRWRPNLKVEVSIPIWVTIKYLNLGLGMHQPKESIRPQKVTLAIAIIWMEMNQIENFRLTNQMILVLQLLNNLILSQIFTMRLKQLKKTKRCWIRFNHNLLCTNMKKFKSRLKMEWEQLTWPEKE